MDRVSRLPRGTTLHEAMHLYHENIALKAQIDALEAHLHRIEAPRRIPLADAFELQFYPDEYHPFANTERPHQRSSRAPGRG